MNCLCSRSAVFAVALATLSLVLSSCSWRSMRPLRIAVPNWAPAEFLHLAREKGYFAAEGVDVQLIEFGFASDLQRTMERKRVDGGVLSIFEILRARDRSDCDLQIMLVIDFSNGADAILASPGIDDMRALRGKVVAFDGGALGLYMLARALELHAMTLDDVIIMPTHAELMVDALEHGTVHAVVTYPPARTQIEQATTARPIFSSAQIPGEIVDVLALDRKVLQERPEDAARLVRAFYRAVQFAASSPQEALEIMARREHVEPKEFEAALRNGLTLVELADQQHFLGDDSQLRAVMRMTNGVMRASGQLIGPQRDLPILDPGPAAAAAGAR